jgi:thiol-disulfide isomerase/thioredoxin
MAPASTLARRPFAVVAIALALSAVACSDGSSAGNRLGEADTDVPSADSRAAIDVDIAYATLDGGEANLSDYSGRPIVLNFFASWCASCVREMPAFEEVHRVRGDEVAFVGMSEDLVASDSLDLIARTGVTYDTGWDPKGHVLNNFRAFVMPTTVFITDAGEVAHTEFGALSVETLDGLIDEHLE